MLDFRNATNAIILKRRWLVLVFHVREPADADAFAREFGGKRLPVGRMKGLRPWG
jgi:hypothetical protein